jgi:hypothetical protein
MLGINWHTRWVFVIKRNVELKRLERETHKCSCSHLNACRTSVFMTL